MSTVLHDFAKLRQWRLGVEACEACSARAEATKPVYASGPPHVDIMVVGRNPGVQEDLEGRPFHPEAPGGKELTWFLSTVGIDRNQTVITNCVNCHTFKDREPTQEEISTCTGLHLESLLLLIKPIIIIATGRVSVEYFIPSVQGISLMRLPSNPVRTKWGIVFPVPHPAVICYDERRREGMRHRALFIKNVLLRMADSIRGFSGTYTSVAN